MVYINGAIADPWLNIIKLPKITKISKIGNNQYFFLIFRNSKNSFKKLIIKTDFSCYFFSQISQSSMK
mgnify:CR=1 FL=1